ncbi:MAG: hypothetical protein BWY59_01521 [Verrucomicrobia bacterium ADurb.Bin345]|nr:MAG: hypothetical protein BWY59_01521 [Verrucomicrobia bacterium ADurb.Bin345]
MAFETMRSVLDYAKKFHQDLAAFYAGLEDRTGQEKMRILLNYMSRHEEHLMECLKQYEADATESILNVWFKYTPDMPQCRCFEKIKFSPDMTVDEIVDAARTIDRCFVDLYRQMAEKAPTPETKDLFKKLLEMEQREEVLCLSNALSFIEQD